MATKEERQEAREKKLKKKANEGVSTSYSKLQAPSGGWSTDKDTRQKQRREASLAKTKKGKKDVKPKRDILPITKIKGISKEDAKKQFEKDLKAQKADTPPRGFASWGQYFDSHFKPSGAGTTFHHPKSTIEHTSLRQARDVAKADDRKFFSFKGKKYYTKLLGSSVDFKGI